MINSKPEKLELDLPLCPHKYITKIFSLYESSISELYVPNLDVYNAPENSFKIQDGFKNLKSLKVVGSQDFDCSVIFAIGYLECYKSYHPNFNTDNRLRALGHILEAFSDEGIKLVNLKISCNTNGTNDIKFLTKILARDN